PANGPDARPPGDASVAVDAPIFDDGGVIEPDATSDAPPVDGPVFPADPQGGEFAWAVSVAGAASSASVAVDGAGNLLVGARQTGEVRLGDVVIPPPTSAEAAVVLKLTSKGAPLWGHALDGHPGVQLRTIATTSSGDVVVGATFRPDAAVFVDDGTVMVLDGETGALRWSTELASAGNDTVAGVAAASDAIYVFGAIGSAATIAGQAMPAGSYLIRYDADGGVRWARSLGDLRPNFGLALAVDPAGGPVLVGDLGAQLTLDGHTVLGPGSVVAAFDPDGVLRLARAVLSSSPSFEHGIAVASAGDIYLASDTSGTETVIDDHVIAIPDFIDHPLLVRLRADGRFAAAAQITGDRFESASQVAVDATGAAYLVTSCHGRVDVQPERSCASAQGGVIVSYGADNAYRWATDIQPAFIDAIAAAPGNRMIVVGQALTALTGFGGVQVPTQALFIAALAGGPARLPSPLPATPVIASAVLDQVPDGQLRQGDTGTLVVRGTALDQVTSAKLGDLDVHLRPGAASADELRLTVMIPHGYPPGPLALELGNAAGVARRPATLTVTPIVVAPRGGEDGRGTFASPMRLCRHEGFTFARYGDVVSLQNGTHECNGRVFVRGGVTIRGESKSGTIVGGVGGANDRFGGFSSVADPGEIGELAVENLTITSSDISAISASGGGGRVAVTDVDVLGAAGSGVWLDEGGRGRVTRYHYLHGTGTAIVVGLIFGSGEVDATDVVVEDAYRGVLMTQGTAKLTRALLSTREVAVQAGDLNAQPGTREVVITSSTLRSLNGGFFGGQAQLTITDTTIEPLVSDFAFEGISQYGGALTARDSRIIGWKSRGIFATPHFGAPSVARDGMTVTLERVEISGSPSGISYQADAPTDRFTMHGARVQAADAAVGLSGPFTADLGTAAVPGDNRLDVTSGEPALLDGRTTAGPPIDAHGTTLNGADFSGDVVGPLTTAGFLIAGPNTIRF
ncbi:MAG: hypothetical protein ABIY55_33130, partial [Kofleriaceae bacterium]